MPLAPKYSVVYQMYSRRAGGYIGKATVMSSDLTYEEARAEAARLHGSGGGRPWHRVVEQVA